MQLSPRVIVGGSAKVLSTGVGAKITFVMNHNTVTPILPRDLASTLPNPKKQISNAKSPDVHRKILQVDDAKSLATDGEKSSSASSLRLTSHHPPIPPNKPTVSPQTYPGKVDSHAAKDSSISDTNKAPSPVKTDDGSKKNLHSTSVTKSGVVTISDDSSNVSLANVDKSSDGSASVVNKSEVSRETMSNDLTGTEANGSDKTSSIVYTKKPSIIEDKMATKDLTISSEAPSRPENAVLKGGSIGCYEEDSNTLKASQEKLL